MAGDAERTWTPNQVVAFNLRRAREKKGWTQEELGHQLAPYLGSPWSKALVSQAERSVDGGRIRPFDADELFAFARALDMPITYFFLPADDERLIGVGGADVEAAPPLTAGRVITRLLGGALDHLLVTAELEERLGTFHSDARRELRARLREAAANSVYGSVGELSMVLNRMMPAMEGLAEAMDIIKDLFAAAGGAQNTEYRKAAKAAASKAERKPRKKEGTDEAG